MVVLYCRTTATTYCINRIGLAASATTLKVSRFLFKEIDLNIEKPSYYAIIPAVVRYDKDLRPNEKLLYGEITALSNATGECWASNNYFANLYSVTPQAVSGWINDLKKKGYITVDIMYKDGTKEIDKRVIRIVSINDYGVVKNFDGGINKSLIPHKQKFKDNNTSINNTRNNIYSDVPAEIKDVFMEWVAMRKNIKKPITTKQTVTRALNKLNQLSQNTAEQIKIIELAIDKCWLGFWPLKQEKPVRTANFVPEPPKYRMLEPDPEIETSQMPEEMRNKYKGFINEL